MSTFRDTPYAAFNFLVELLPGEGRDTIAGFSEASGLNLEITVAEYRAGNDPVNYVRKIPGVVKAGDITLKRGVIGASNLYDWIDPVRRGDIKLAKRTVQIKLLNETRQDVVVTWTLRGAMPLKWTGPSLAAKGGGDVAIEEFVLSVESLEQE